MKIAFDPQVAMPQLSQTEKDGSRAENPAGLRRMCQDFEALLIHSMFKQMRRTIPRDGYLEHDMSMAFYEEIMDMEVAREMSRQGGLGLAERMYGDFQKNAAAGKKFS